MSVFLEKLAAVLLLPPGSLLALGALAALLAALGRRRAAASIIGLGALLLWLLSTPLVSHWLITGLEADYPPVAAGDLPKRGAIVLLGGGLGTSADPEAPGDLRGSADRIWHAARAWHAGRAPLILVSGGNVFPNGRRTEADGTREFLEDLGVPRTAILLEDRSRNTWQNAELTRERLAEAGIPDVLLVTSAYHMRRAMLSFAAAGVDAWPAPTDHAVPTAAPLLLRLLPNSDALATSADALKEHLGRLRYRLRALGDRPSPI